MVSDEASAEAIRKRFGLASYDAAVVLGSGWGPLLDAWPDPIAATTYAEVGLRPPVAPGHAGQLVAFEHKGHRTLVFSGRTHLYEGHGPAEVSRNVRVAAALGVKTLVLTNANGALFQDWPLGQIMMLTDHLNLTGTSPLHGATFVDLTETYSLGLRQRARHEAELDGIDLVEGIYAMLPGPHYETAAEARAISLLGAQALGMSSVLEAIEARAHRMDVLALSTVTAHEASGEIIDPDEVVEIAGREAGRLGPSIWRLIEGLGV
ncbi:purine-nucleoside phosphorylase [Changpingibacter yushuensis]|uniref:purine-nucleoside phosphorylase n=1 Tax=Changpingibacter yushuensis TaxID=2758440 RepID=UPI0015F46727|nr:purine-nucleoside phosphorylase [Changpingibacter yushuensis]